MAYIHLFKNANSTSWSGGKTTELFIFPADSSYLNRDFGFRISSATIEIETSDFTSLPDYNRLLTVLEGELEIIHEGKYAKQLSALESDAFHGSWNTKSKGKARDFNVIYTDKYILEFQVSSLDKDTKITKKSAFLFLLVLNESVLFEGMQLKKYDLIEVTDETIALGKGFSFLQVALEINNPASQDQ